jgi:hypothetical protein
MLNAIKVTIVISIFREASELPGRSSSPVLGGAVNDDIMALWTA